MAIITQTDKRSGITYAYDTTYYWDKDKKQSRAKRTCVGKVDPVTGGIIPTRGRTKKAEQSALAISSKTGPKPFIEPKHLYYGATYLLEALSEEIGLTSDLRKCFPDTYKQLLSVAFYLIIEDNNPLYRFEKWHMTHRHPCGYDITSGRSSELFASIKDNQVNQFFRFEGKRRVEDEYWAYDNYIRVQNIFDQMYYTRIRTHYDWWEGGLGGLGNKVTSFQKMPQIAPVPRDDESFYTSEGVFESDYKSEYLKKGERLAVSCGCDEKKLVISAEKQFKGYTISYWYTYYVKTKQLKESIGYYSSDQKYSKNTQEAIALAEKSGLTEKKLVQYKKYFLYDKLLTDWLAVNSSRFSIDHWGHGKFIEELPPISTLSDSN